MKKALISIVMLTALVAFGATQAQAADIAVTVTLTLATASVVVDVPTWVISASGATQAVVATNDTSDRTEDLAIKCTDGTFWAIGPAAGTNVFVMTATGGDLAGPLTVADQTLEADVVAGGTVNFTLEFTAPSSTDEPNDSMTVTVSAS